MTTAVQVPYNIYNATGSVSTFPYTFQISQQADLKVFLNGTEVTSGFTVSGINVLGGGNVVFTSGNPTGTLFLRRKTSLSRLTDYTPAAALPSDTLDADVDSCVRMIQDLDAGVVRYNTGDLNISLNGISKITNSLPPTSGLDLVTKDYVDSTIPANVASAAASAAAAAISATSAMNANTENWNSIVNTNITQTWNQNASTYNTIVNTDAGGSAAARFTAVTAGTAGAATRFATFGNNAGSSYVLSYGVPLDVGTITGNTLYLKTNNTTRLSIDSAGNTTSNTSTFVQEATVNGSTVTHIVKNLSNTSGSLAMLDLHGGIENTHILRFQKYGSGNSGLGSMVSYGGGNYQNLVYNTGNAAWSAYDFYPNDGGKQLLESSDAAYFNGFGYGSGTGAIVSYAQTFNNTTVAAINFVNFRAEFQSTTFAAGSVSYMWIPNVKLGAYDHIILTPIQIGESYLCTWQALNDGSGKMLIVITNPLAVDRTFVPKFNICIIKGSIS